jgi:type I restriction enzyme, S subunit
MTVNPTTSPSWPNLALGDLVIVGGGRFNPGQEPAQEVNYISLENIEAGTGRIVGFEPTTGRKIGSVKTTFGKGDILYCRLRPYLQKVIIAPFDGIAATDLLPLQPHGAIDPEFLRDFLLGPQHLSDVTQSMSGARMPRVHTQDLLRLNVPVPRLEEQRRIVRGLAVIRYRIAEIRRKLVESVDLAQEYEQSLLTEAYSVELSAMVRQRSVLDQDGKELLDRILAERRTNWEATELSRMRPDDPLRDDKRSTHEGMGIGISTGVKKLYPEPVAHDEVNLMPLPPGWTWASLSQLSSAADPIATAWYSPATKLKTVLRSSVPKTSRTGQ